MESRRRRSRSQLLKWGCYVLALFVCAALQTTPGLFQLGRQSRCWCCRCVWRWRYLKENLPEHCWARWAAFCGIAQPDAR